MPWNVRSLYSATQSCLTATGQLWLFVIDTGDGLDPADCAAVSRLRVREGGLMVTRGHADWGRPSAR